MPSLAYKSCHALVRLRIFPSHLPSNLIIPHSPKPLLPDNGFVIPAGPDKPTVTEVRMIIA